MPSNKPVIAAKIQSNKHRMTFAENEVANFTLQYPDVVIDNTITILSDKIGVSEASINRFCKKIGFKGFNDFKIAIAQDNYYRNMQNIQREKQSMTFSDSLAFDYKELIDITNSLIDDNKLDKIIELIENASQIYIVAFLDTINVGRHLKYQLMMLNIQAELCSDPYLLHVIVNNCSQEDLIIVISETGKIKQLNNILTEKNRNNTNNISMTSYENSELNNFSTECLIIPNRLSINSNSLISSFISYFFTIDSLIGKMIKSNKAYQKLMLENEGIITSFGIQNDLFR